ncbi:MAG: energy-coupling factor transporter ATPase, partial [Oscillospiraceae bacterium]|nr:energy-coupling factor transporter ATPase [Oscillospiraceae bacterium]
DRLVAMSDGKVVMDGTPREIFSQVDRLRELGLDVPQTVDLMFRLNKEGFSLPLDALSPDECAEAIACALHG